jgi:zinc transport system substrate-binding protein
MRKVFIVFLLFFSCNKEEQNSSVLVTIPPYGYFVERISQNKLQMEILVPPGTNPHVYEPNPKQVKNILGVRVWFQTGEILEQKILTVLKEYNPQLQAVDLSQGFPLLTQQHCDHHDEGRDVHIWMSPKLAQKQARIIAETLTAAFPNEKATFDEGLQQLLHDLEALDAEIRERLKPYAGDAILVSHPAFGYFCAEYGLIQLSVECDGKDPLPQDIIETLHEAEEHYVRTVLTQTQYNNKGAILIAEKLKLPVYQVDPYAIDYIENLRHLSRMIAHD